MKLRMRTNSVRLRLTRSEVNALAEGKPVSEEVRFGAGDDMRLTYSIESRDVPAIRLQYQPGRLSIYIPAAEAREWASSERVGFEEALWLEDGVALNVVVEKDFKCLTDRPGEDESDAFPHPEASHGHVC